MWQVQYLVSYHKSHFLSIPPLLLPLHKQLPHQSLIQLKQKRNPLAIFPKRSPVSRLHGLVELLVRLEQSGRHGDGVVQIRKAGIWKLSTGIQYILCRFLNRLFLLFRRVGPRKVIVHNIL